VFGVGIIVSVSLGVVVSISFSSQSWVFVEVSMIEGI